MKREVHYKESYKIVITGRFYEVISGNRVLYYDELSHSPTVQEVWNKTIGLYRNQEFLTNARRN